MLRRIRGPVTTNFFFLLSHTWWGWYSMILLDNNYCWSEKETRFLTWNINFTIRRPVGVEVSFSTRFVRRGAGITRRSCRQQIWLRLTRSRFSEALNLLFECVLSCHSSSHSSLHHHQSDRLYFRLLRLRLFLHIHLVHLAYIVHQHDQHEPSVSAADSFIHNIIYSWMHSSFLHSMNSLESFSATHPSIHPINISVTKEFLSPSDSNEKETWSPMALVSWRNDPLNQKEGAPETASNMRGKLPEQQTNDQAKNFCSCCHPIIAKSGSSEKEQGCGTSGCLSSFPPHFLCVYIGRHKRSLGSRRTGGGWWSNDGKKKGREYLWKRRSPATFKDITLDEDLLWGKETGGRRRLNSDGFIQKVSTLHKWSTS